MVSLHEVSKIYPDGTRVLENVSFELKKGDFLYLIGGTGAGKSSLLRLVATEDHLSSGRLSLFGYDLQTASASTLRAIRQVIGHIPQSIRLIPDFTVFDNVALSLSLSGKRHLSSSGRNKCDEILERLGLADKKNTLAVHLSGGEAQRVAAARALVRSPELVVADEPTGAQDRESTWSMMDLFLKSNSGGATVLIATHDREIVKRVRKKCLVLKEGRIHRIQLEDQQGAPGCYL